MAAASVVPAPSDLPENLKVVTRYQDSYHIARVIDWIGWAIKALGVVLAGIVFGIAVYAYMSTTNPNATNQGMINQGIQGLPVPQSGDTIAKMLVFMAVGIGVTFYVYGMLVSAGGQLLLAALDCAVNSSPFLSNAQRADAMSLH